MQQNGRTTLGILLMVGFALVAPAMDASAKLIGDAVAVGQVAATRFVCQAILLLPLALMFGWLHRPKGAEISLHLLRASLLLVATACFFTALRFMPLAETISIFFVEPFILVLLGGLLLGEKVARGNYLACAIGFGGALLIIKPSFETVGFAALLPLVTAVTFAFYMVLTRRMVTRMHPIALQVYTSLAAMTLALPILWAFDGSGVGPLDPVWPEQREFLLLLAVGVIATLSHVLISFALYFAPASIIAPIQYLEILSATILGLLIFGDFPDGLSFVGIALIVGSGLYVFLRERKIEQKHRVEQKGISAQP